MKVKDKKQIIDDSNWRMIFDTVNDGISLTDKEGKILIYNKAMEKLLERPNEEIIGGYCDKLLDQIDHPLDTCPRELVKISKKREIRTIKVEKVWFNCIIDPILDENKEIINLIHIISDLTPLKYAEERYRDLFQNAPDGIVTINKLGFITDINEAGLNNIGYSRDEIIGMNFSKLAVFGKEDIAKYLKLFTAFILGKDIKPYEVKWKHKSGRTVFGEVHQNRIMQDGKLKGVQIIVRNITERKKALEALRISQKRLSSFMNSATDSFSIWDSKLNLLSLNKVALEMFPPGTTMSSLIGKNMSEITPDVVKSGRYKKYLNIIKTGKPHRFDSYTNPELGDRYLSNRAFKVDDGLGILTTDISKNKKAEEELRISRDHYRNLFDNMLEGFAHCKMLYDANSRPIDWIYLSVNKAFEPLTGLKNIVGKKVTKAIPGIKNSNPELFEIYSRVSLTGKPESFEDYIVPLSIWLYISVFSPAKGEFVAVFQNITDRKKAEVELRKSYDALQKTLNDAISTLASIVEIRDPYTSGHQKNVALLATGIAEELGLDKDNIEAIGIAAVIHDIGKINIPPSILARPGKISDIEYSMIKTHPQVGYDMVKNIHFPWPIADFVLQHHERLDGSGYPNGLKEKDILLEARILAVADVIEAMASHRPYRPALGIDKALKEIKKGKGKLYDTKVVEACVKIIAKKEFKFLNG